MPDAGPIRLSESDFARLSLCFAPQSAAIIGASTNPLKFGGRALKFCLERGYSGRLYPINARNDRVQGVSAYRHVSDLPEAPDIAVIAVPASQVREAWSRRARRVAGSPSSTAPGSPKPAATGRRARTSCWPSPATTTCA